VHAIIIFDEMQNGAIWGHFKVSYNIESSTILMTDRLHIHRDFEVDLYKAMEVFVSAKTRRADF
jgi:hypothetical protein